MPIYDYLCNDCLELFEVKVPPVRRVVCEHCRHQWKVRIGMGAKKLVFDCPACGRKVQVARWPAHQCITCGSYNTRKVTVEVPALYVDWDPSAPGDTGMPIIKGRARSKRWRDDEDDE